MAKITYVECDGAEHPLTEFNAAPNDPALEVSAQQSVQELERALWRLSPKARATFIWHRRDGLTLEEIGDRLGLSRAMAKKHLAKAPLEFRKQLVELE